MSSSYMDRGGSVGSQNPKDKELQRQFWAGGVQASNSNVGSEASWSNQLMTSLQLNLPNMVPANGSNISVVENHHDKAVA